MLAREAPNNSIIIRYSHTIPLTLFNILSGYLVKNKIAAKNNGHDVFKTGTKSSWLT